MNYQKPVNILLIEDDPADAELAKRVLTRAYKSCVIHHVENGEKACLFLRKVKGYEQSPKIHLVLLDLNLPGKDGFSVLDEIKQDKKLASTPVVVLSTSQSASDIKKCYELGANAYMNKSVDFHEFEKQILKMAEYWFSTVKIPA